MLSKLQHRYVIIFIYHFISLSFIIKSYIIINKLSELQRHPILFVHFFSIPTFFHFLNFLSLM